MTPQQLTLYYLNHPTKEIRAQDLKPILLYLQQLAIDMATVDQDEEIIDASVDDASDTAKGITKLSLAAATPTNPIAVGDNDPRNTNARTPLSHAASHVDGTDDIQDATDAQKGLLTAADWIAFNAKLSSIIGIAAGGDLSGTYPDPAVLNSAVLAKVLTGLNVIGASIAATDNLLEAFGKLQNQINGVLGGATYQGVYNATTNSPTLIDGTGTQGHYYVVSVGGTQNFGSGAIDFAVGDWVIYNGAIWQKVDNTDAVSSVNGFIGAVNLTTANITEVANLYFTTARVLSTALTGYVSGAGTVAATDTILQAIQKLNGNIVALGTSKQDALSGAKRPVFYQSGVAASSTNTTAEEVLRAIPISAALMGNNDMITYILPYDMPTKTTTHTLRVRLHTAATVGGTIYGTLSSGVAQLSAVLRGEIFMPNSASAQASVPTGITAYVGQAAAGLITSSLSTAVTWYILVTSQKGAGTDTCNSTFAHLDITTS